MIEYTLIRAARKTVGIRLTQSGEIEVRAPHSVSKAYIERLLEQKRSWIEKTRARIKTDGASLEPGFGAKVLYLGREYRLTESPAKKLKAPEISEDRLFVYAKSGESAADAYERALRSSAAEYLPKRLAELRERFGTEECRVRISKARTRWGSCSRARGRMPVISLSLRLMQLPEECIDAVIIHELCHLTVGGHGKDFYALMESRNPDWRDDYAKEKKSTRRCMSWQV